MGEVQHWHFQIIVDENTGRYNVARLDEDFVVSGACWKDWCGNPERMVRTAYDGDEPELYARFKRGGV